ncbi:hypothetical protein KIPB_000841 [Kipferlia bialata]|uniref:Uncharacterized protein n=1 Tax=Kipferlia bialata TaxID=797122 RepID=A0A9K3CPS1_9EUKA|nr:hypothetical protein KIPB_000841 [Kipferlia bialata]|eukprot:g841.t1
MEYSDPLVDTTHSHLIHTPLSVYVVSEEGLEETEGTWYSVDPVGPLSVSPIPPESVHTHLADMLGGHTHHTLWVVTNPTSASSPSVTTKATDDEASTSSATLSPTTFRRGILTPASVCVVDASSTPVGGEGVECTVQTVRPDRTSVDASYTGVWDTTSSCYTLRMEVTYDSAANVYIDGCLVQSIDITTRDPHTRPILHYPSEEQGGDGDLLGSSVSLSGSTLLVGAPGAGEARVMEVVDDTLTVTSTLSDPDIPLFGEAVSIDGEWAAVGGYTAGGACSVRLYHYQGSDWVDTTQVFSPITSDAGGVAVTLEGGLLAIGCMAAEDSGAVGSATVYTVETGTWVMESFFVGTDAGYGHSVSLDSVSGTDMLAVGGKGSAYVYTRDTSSGVWDTTPYTVETDTTDEEDEDYPYNGSLLSVSMYDTVLAVGIPLKEELRVYNCPEGTCSYLNRLTHTSVNQDSLYGVSVELYGNSMAVGVPGRRTEDGGLFIYQRTTSTSGWRMTSYVDAYYNEYLGYSVAISSSMAVGGMPRDNSSEGTVLIVDEGYTVPVTPPIIGGFRELKLDPVRDSYGEAVVDTVSINMHVNGAYAGFQWLEEEEKYLSLRQNSYPPGSSSSVGYYVRPVGDTRPVYLRLWHSVSIIFGPTVGIDALPAMIEGDHVELRIYNENGLAITDANRAVSIAWTQDTPVYVDAVWDSEREVHLAALSPSTITSDTSAAPSAPVSVTVTSSTYGTLGVEGEVALFSAEGLSSAGVVTVAPTSFAEGVTSSVLVTVVDGEGRVVGGNHADVTVVAGEGSCQVYWDQDLYAFEAEVVVREQGTLQVVYGSQTILSEPDIYTYYPYTVVREMQETEDDAVDIYTYGDTVAISGDWAAVANPLRDSSSYGYVYLYHRVEGCVWELSQTVRIYRKERVSVALDGEWLVIGKMATIHHDVDIYKLIEGQWELHQVFYYSSVVHFYPELDVFLNSVSMRDGLLVVGRPEDRSDVNGYVYVYQLRDNIWQSVGRIPASTILGDGIEAVAEFGCHVYTDGVRVGVGSLVSTDASVTEATESHISVFEQFGTSTTSWEVVISSAGDRVAMYHDTVAISKYFLVSNPEPSVDIYALVDGGSVDESGDPILEWRVQQTLSGSREGDFVPAASSFGATLAFFHDTLVVGGGVGLNMYQPGTEGWDLRWQSTLNDSERPIESVAIGGDAVLAQVGEGRVAFFESNWDTCPPEGIELSVDAGNYGVSVALTPTAADLWVDDEARVGIEYKSDKGEYPLLLQDGGDEDSLLWSRDTQWLVPGTVVLADIDGMRYQSDYVRVNEHTVNVITGASSTAPSLVLVSTGGVQSITGVALADVYPDGLAATVVIGDDGVVRHSIIDTNETETYSVAVFDTPLDVPSSWQQGASGQVLPVPLSVTIQQDGVEVSEAGTGWITASSTVVIPTRGEVVHQDMDPVPRGACSEVQVALYDADDNYVSCASPGVAIEQPSSEPDDRYVLYPLGTTSHCTMHFCVPDNAPVNSRILITYEGRTLVSVPVAVSAAVDTHVWVTASYLCMPLLVIVLGCVSLGVSTKHLAPPPPDIVEACDDASTRTFRMFYPINVVVLGLLRVLGFAIDFYVVLRFLGYFWNVRIATRLTTLPVVKYPVLLSSWLAAWTSSVIKGIADRDTSPLVCVLWYMAGCAILVALVVVLFRLCEMQVKASEHKSRLYVYPPFHLAKSVGVIAGCILSDMVLWMVVGGTGLSKGLALLLIGVVAVLCYTLIAFFGNMEIQAVIVHTQESLEMFYDWLRGGDKRRRLLLRWLGAVFVGPSYLSYMVLSPFTHSLAYVLMSVCGVYECLSATVERVTHLVVCVLLGAVVGVFVYPFTPYAAGIAGFCLFSDLVLSLLLDPKTRFDPYTVAQERVRVMNRRVWDLRKDPIKQDPTMAERYVELNSALRRTSLLVCPLVGPVLSTVGDTLSSPPLLVPGVRRYTLNWSTNLISLVCLFSLVVNTDRAGIRVLALMMYVILQAFDVCQRSRMLAKRFRRAGYIVTPADVQRAIPDPVAEAMRPSPVARVFGWGRKAGRAASKAGSKLRGGNPTRAPPVPTRTPLSSTRTRQSPPPPPSRRQETAPPAEGVSLDRLDASQTRTRPSPPPPPIRREASNASLLSRSESTSRKSPPPPPSRRSAAPAPPVPTNTERERASTRAAPPAPPPRSPVLGSSSSRTLLSSRYLRCTI